MIAMSYDCSDDLTSYDTISYECHVHVVDHRDELTSYDTVSYEHHVYVIDHMILSDN